jgi:hypothetical protein
VTAGADFQSLSLFLLAFCFVAVRIFVKIFLGSLNPTETRVTLHLFEHSFSQLLFGEMLKSAQWDFVLVLSDIEISGANHGLHWLGWLAFHGLLSTMCKIIGIRLRTVIDIILFSLLDS